MAFSFETRITEMVISVFLAEIDGRACEMCEV